jgi:hypothetical protein
MVLSRAFYTFHHVLNYRPSQNKKRNIWLDETTEKEERSSRKCWRNSYFIMDFLHQWGESTVGYISYEGNSMKFINVSQAIVDKLSRRSLQSAW